MSRHFKLYYDTGERGRPRSFLASYTSEQAARDAVETWFGQLPKIRCYDIALAMNHRVLEVWTHPELDS